MVILNEKYQLQLSIWSENRNEQSVEEIYLDVLPKGK